MLEIFPAFWGANWGDAAHQTQATRLVQFLNDLLASEFVNVLTQYGVNPGGRVQYASYNNSVPANLTDAGIQHALQSAINSATMPEPPPNNAQQVVVIFLGETTAVNDANIVMCEPRGDNAFGYHSGFTTTAGNKCYYSVIPALDDACINNSCPSGGCSLSLRETQEQRRTQVTSHEIAEMATDPNFPTGWFGQTSDEIGDICNGQSVTITVGQNAWTVQAIYSKTDDINTNGATFCRATVPNPLPRLPGGPPEGP